MPSGGSILNGKQGLALLAAEMSASLSFMVLLMVQNALMHSRLQDFALPTNREMFNGLLMAFAGTFLGFVYCSLVAPIPFYSALFICEKLKIENRLLFLIGGALTGVCFGPVFLAAIPNFGFNETLESLATEPTFLEKFLAFVPVCGASGLMAGFAAEATLRCTSRTSAEY
jgi:hypothetical protein